MKAPRKTIATRGIVVVSALTALLAERGGEPATAAQ